MFFNGFHPQLFVGNRISGPASPCPTLVFPIIQGQLDAAKAPTARRPKRRFANTAPFPRRDPWLKHIETDCSSGKAFMSRRISVLLGINGQNHLRFGGQYIGFCISSSAHLCCLWSSCYRIRREGDHVTTPIVCWLSRQTRRSEVLELLGVAKPREIVSWAPDGPRPLSRREG